MQTPMPKTSAIIVHSGEKIGVMLIGCVLGARAGMGHDGAIVSFHRNYSEYVDFTRRLKQITFADPSKFESFLIDLNDNRHHRYLTFSFLSSHVVQTLQKKSKG